MKHALKSKLLIIVALILILISLSVLLIYKGIICLNHPSAKNYPVRGVDVSVYQGDIDWGILSKQNIEFAFIKATEGSSFKDEKFQYNWGHANKTTLKIGAYHFFSYDSSGQTQAENFIKAVPKLDGTLPPVVDIEFYGDKKKKLPDKERTALILDELLEKLESHYGQKPIIYATKKSYNSYIKDKYKDYPIWIRDVFLSPNLSDNRKWTFWQYCDKIKLNGYKGKEQYIDMNVFNGSLNDFYKTFK